ncbi:MAG: class I SAM-dependent methyltransferase [archaeon]|nr:class I SAM-dependent methyltransferase [archaeon]
MDEGELDKMEKFGKTHWWYKARAELLAGFVPNAARTMLEVGPGTGNNMLAAKKRGILVEGVEINKKAAQSAQKKGLSIYNSSLEDFRTNKKYDVILAADVLEHIEDDGAALKKIKKMLNKDGRLVLTVPAFQFLFSRHDELCGHYRRYEKNGLRKKLEAAGFDAKFCSYWNFFLFAPIAAVKIIKRRFGKESGSDVSKTPGPVNSFLEAILRLENWCIKKGIAFPFGISIIFVAVPGVAGEKNSNPQKKTL